MARDLGKFGIRVVAIAPGVFKTPLDRFIPQEIKEKLMRDTPMGRTGDPNEFADFVQTMVENNYINGVSLRIDGAIVMSYL